MHLAHFPIFLDGPVGRLIFFTVAHELVTARSYREGPSFLKEISDGVGDCAILPADSILEYGCLTRLD